MKEYNGLKNLREHGNKPYCPKCGNYLEVVSNGFFHGELFFCPKEDKVFKVALIDITKRAGKEFIEQSAETIKLQEIRYKINKKNLKEVEEFLKSKT